MIDGFVEDLSRNGMFLRSAERIGAGSSAEIELDLDVAVPGQLPLRLDAEVVRVEHSPSREGMAFRFVSPQVSNRPLANFLMRQHQSSQ